MTGFRHSTRLTLLFSCSLLLHLEAHLELYIDKPLLLCLVVPPAGLFSVLSFSGLPVMFLCLTYEFLHKTTCFPDFNNSRTIAYSHS